MGAGAALPEVEPKLKAGAAVAGADVAAGEVKSKLGVEDTDETGLDAGVEPPKLNVGSVDDGVVAVED